MKYQAFIDTINDVQCPPGLAPCLQALWYDANDDWHKAHIIVQDRGDRTAARIHAYLHRKEGDIWNSNYWHRQAGSRFPDGMSLEDEWDMLVRGLTE